MVGGLSESAVAQEIVLESFSGVGARAMGMGGAYVSLSNDFSGMFWNPAGLAGVKRGEVHWEAMHSRFENASQFFGSPSVYEITSTRVGAIGAVLPYPVYRGSLVFAGGFGRNVTFDSGLDLSGYDSVVKFEKSGYSEDRGALGAWTLGAAMDLAPNLSVGLAVYRWRGSNRFAQELTLDDTQNAHRDTVQLYQRFASTDRYSAWGAQGGMLFLHPSGFRLGLTAAATRPVKVAMTLEDEFKDVFDSRTDTYPRETYRDDYAIQVPFAFAVGVGFTRRALTVTGDVHYGDVQEASYETPPGVISANVTDFRQQYRNAMRLHLGAEYAFEKRGLAVRAGYYRDPVRYVGGGVLPNVTVVQEKDAWTLGFGAELAETALLDVAAVFGGYQIAEGNRDDHVRTLRVLASVRFQFDVKEMSQ
jgi:long-subunit fatty acid transport protein